MIQDADGDVQRWHSAKGVTISYMGQIHGSNYKFTEVLHGGEESYALTL